MDKYDYKLKTEQMLDLMEDGAYRQAAEVADTIDWKKVRNAAMLTNVSEIYEKNKEYQKGYDVLSLVFRRAEGSRKVISRLCTLALKTGNVDEAIDYYDDFIQVAPKDPNQYILRYQILRAQRAPIEQQIEALEEYKKSEYIEEWAYELAKLYQEAGMTAECLEECDDLILWFSEGQYVYKAMELKMQYKPLTPSQQEKYDRRYEKHSVETEEMPDIITYAEVQNAGSDREDTDDAGIFEDEISAKESISAEDDPVRSGAAGTSRRKQIGDVMPLGEALKKLLRPEKQEPAAVNAGDDEEEEPELDDLKEAIGEIESVADIDIVAQIADERKKAAAAAGEMTEIIPGDDALDETSEIMLGNDVIDETSEIMLGADVIDETPEIVPGADAIDETPEIVPGADAIDETPESIPGADALDGTSEIMLDDAEELPPDKEEDAAEEAELITDEPADEAASRDEDAAGTAGAEGTVPEATGEVAIEDQEYVPIGDAGKTAEKKPRTNAGQITGQMSLEDILAGWEGEPKEKNVETPEEEILETSEEEILETSEEEILETSEGEILETSEEEILEANAEELDDDMTEGEMTGDKMEENKTTAPILPPDIQRMIDEIEGVIPPEEEKKTPVKKTLERKTEEPRENMGKVAESLRLDDDDGFDIDVEEEYFDESEEFDGDDEYLDEAEDFGNSEYQEDFDEGEELGDSGEYFDEGEEYFDEGEELGEAEEYFDEDEMPDIHEEFRVNPGHAEQEDDREIPDDDDDDMDILSATAPLSRKETAKMIATGKTAPLPLDEISDALSMSDTGFIVHGRYDLEMQSGIGTRAGLTEEQKKLFSYFVPVRGMSEQLVDVLEQDKNCTNRDGTSKSGNLLIIGNKGSGKTVLAVDVVKAIQKQRNIKQGKVAIVTGDSLNKKKISDIFDKLYGGALIIEKAGKMNEKTVARLNKAMEGDTGELLIVLEEQRKPIDRLLSSNREFRRKFTSRLEIPVFINDELVTFGQTYAQENGYRIDEMGILALYSKIDSLQREDHAVTVAEVKAIMDEAIQHSQKASAKKLMKRVFGKNTDEADRIILSEKDINI